MAAPGRCSFFVEKKKRFCKMIPARGKTLCGEHATTDSSGSIRRIVCPLDPKHTVSEDKLEKHLKKCNARDKPKPIYYVENINSGPDEGDQTLQQVSLCELSRSQMDSLLDKLKSAIKGLQCCVEDSVLSHSVLQDELTDPKNGDSANKHLKQQSSLLSNLSSLGLLTRGRCFIEFGAGKGKLSHWIHQALRGQEGDPKTNPPTLNPNLTPNPSLTPNPTINPLTQESHPKTNPNPDPPTPSLSPPTLNPINPNPRESNTNPKGQGSSLNPPAPSADLQILLVERSSTRFKVDGKHQDSSVQFERLQVDIQHLDLSKVPLIRQKTLPLVGVGKHLCGAATDLALRCLLETPEQREETGPEPKRFRPEQPGSDATAGVTTQCRGTGPVVGVCIALCCHHRCEWKHYVGRSLFRERGLGQTEFAAFCRMSSWATCGLRPAYQERAGEGRTNQERDLTNEEPAAAEWTNQGRAGHQRTNEREEEEEHEPIEEMEAVTSLIPSSQRHSIGLLCKRLIDSGRMSYLEERGFEVKLKRYAEPHVTLENVLLTAVPRTHT